MVEITRNRVIYRLEDKPPLPKALVLAMQHVLTMFGATVSVPLLFQAPLEMGASELAILVSSVMICSGIATLLQVTIGSRLPIIQGVSFSFLAAFFACIAFAKANPVAGISHGALSMQYIAGSIIVGSLVEMVVGFTGLMGKLRKVLSPVVIGPVIMLIGLALFQHGAPKAGQHWPIALLTIGLIILFSLVLSHRHQIFRIFPILMAIVTAWLVCFICSQTGVFNETHPAYINLSGVGAAPWFRLNLVGGEYPVLFPWGLPRFDVGLIFAALAGFLASMIESFGDYHACASMAETSMPSDKQINRGIGSEGLGCLATGMFGGFSSTSYSENIGLVGITKVASLYVVMIGACLLLFLGVFTKFAAVVATIPSPVVGGIYCSLFGLISAVGIQQLSKADLHSERNLFIAGFSLFMGLSVPAYFLDIAHFHVGMGDDLAKQLNTILMSHPDWKAEELVKVLMVYPPGAEPLLQSIQSLPTVGEPLAKIVKAIGETGMAVAAMLGLLLDNLIPGTDEERGLV